MEIHETEVAEEDEGPTTPLEVPSLVVRYTKKRWTTSRGMTSVKPTDIVPPPGYEWSSDWKIDVGGNRDAQGWEYYEEDEVVAVGAAADEQPPAATTKPPWVMRPRGRKRRKRKRRRRWLRTMSPILKKADDDAGADGEESPLTGASAERKKRSSRRRSTRAASRQIQRTVSSVRDDFRFKGFGWSFYKSLLFRDTVGMAFRLPLSTNFDSLDRRPLVPTASMSVAAYYPPMAVCLIDISLPFEFLRHVLYQALQYLQRVLLFAVLLLTGLRSKVELPPWDPSPVRYSQNIQERLGITFSWRVSEKRGYEFRISKFFMYLPTMEYLLQIVGSVGSTFFDVASRMMGEDEQQHPRDSSDSTADRTPSSSTAKSGDDLSDAIQRQERERQLVDWLRQHTSSLGVSLGHRIPDPPHYACSVLCSMSGFQYVTMMRKAMRKRRRIRSAPSSATSQPHEPGEDGSFEVGDVYAQGSGVASKRRGKGHGKAEDDTPDFGKVGGAASVRTIKS